MMSEENKVTADELQETQETPNPVTNPAPEPAAVVEDEDNVKYMTP